MAKASCPRDGPRTLREPVWRRRRSPRGCSGAVSGLSRSVRVRPRLWELGERRAGLKRRREGSRALCWSPTARRMGQRPEWAGPHSPTPPSISLNIPKHPSSIPWHPLNIPQNILEPLPSIPANPPVSPNILQYPPASQRNPPTSPNIPPALPPEYPITLQHHPVSSNTPSFPQHPPGFSKIPQQPQASPSIP